MINRYYPGISDPNSAWKNHINSQASLDEINSSLRQQKSQSSKQSEKLRETIANAKRDYIDAINGMSKDISSSINYCASNICGSLDQGFDLLSNDIHELGRSLDIRLSLIIEQQIINNLISENIALLLRIPDFLKEKQYYLEQGLKHLKNALIDPSFYKHALENLLEAEKKEKTDYVILHHIGMIYLYSAKYLDFSKAESYFREAGRFAKIESDPNAAKLANIMTGSVLTKLAANISDIHKMRYVAAESYLQGAIACYNQKKYNEASELGQIAFDLAPEMLEAGFYTCLSYALDGKKDLSIKLLETLVDKNSGYAVIAAMDPVLAPKDYVQAWLFDLKQKTVNEALNIANDFKKKLLKNSKFNTDLNTVQSKLHEASYLDALKIIKYFDHELPFIEEYKVHNYNINNLESLRAVIKNNNKTVSELKNSDAIGYRDMLTMGSIEISKYENMLSSTDSCDQWLLSSEIFTSAKKFLEIATKNVNLLHDNYSKLKKIENNIRQIRNQTADNIDKNKKIVRKIGLIVSFILGFRSCFNTSELPDSGGSLMAPFGSFFIVFFIGSAFTFLVLWIMNVVEKRYRSKCKQEMEIDEKCEYLGLYKQRFNRLIILLSKIEIVSLKTRYTPFINYIVK